MVLFFAVSSCRCGTTVNPVGPPSLRVTEHLSLPDAFIGHASSALLEVTNAGGTVELEFSTTGAFSVEPTKATLASGVTEAVRVTFTPTVEGAAEGTLGLGDLQVRLLGVGLQPPVCVASSACLESSLDLELKQCVERPRSEGSSCVTRCVVDGRCDATVCRGSARSCDDGDACTIDACDETTGCQHTPRTCQVPSDPCREARCDAVRGCIEEPVVDGVVCGRDDCLATNTEVCISGVCVNRPRPELARCRNRWVPTSPPRDPQLAFDRRRGRLVAYDPPSRETWEFDGARWLHRLPLARPPASISSALSWNGTRQRVTLFRSDSIWEWDGTTWTQRPSSTTLPPGDPLHAAWDEVRQRVVASFDEFRDPRTCDWDGTAWLQCRSGGGALAWDESRRQVIMTNTVGTFSWSRTGWTHVSNQGSWCSLAGDPVRRVVVTWCLDGLRELRGDVWGPPLMSGPRRDVAWDTTRQRLLMTGGSTTSVSVWDGSTLTEVAPLLVPPAEFFEAQRLAVDPATNDLLLLVRDGDARVTVTWALAQEWVASVFAGGIEFGTPTIDASRSKLVALNSEGTLVEWDARRWSVVVPGPTPVPPVNGYRAAMTYDPRAGQLLLLQGVGAADALFVLDGGWNEIARSPFVPSNVTAAAFDPVEQLTRFHSTNVWDPDAGTTTWWWNGTQLDAGSFLPEQLHEILAWDPVRQRLLSASTPDTFEWNGTEWMSSIQGTPDHVVSMVFDPRRGRMVLWNGALWELLPP